MNPAAGLHLESTGRGADLVLVHGWGLNAAVWEPLLPALETRFRVHRLELPGHGRSPAGAPGADLEHWAAQAGAALAPVAPSAVWVGWSLGGMLALQVAADFPERVSGLVCVAASPRFSAAPDWPEGVPAQVLDGFAAALAQDYAGTLGRFLALQTRGSDAARETLRALRGTLLARGEPQVAALEVGLSILRTADLRALLPGLRQPLRFIGGERDTLAAPAVLRRAAALAPPARAGMIAGAGHAPFLSHPQAFLEQLDLFFNHAGRRALAD